MNLIGIAIGATGLLLLGLFVWMLALSIRSKRLQQERKEREIAQRKAMEKMRKRELEERVMKAEDGHVPTILFLAKEAERKNVKEALYWYDKAAKLDNLTGMYGIVRISNQMRQDLILKEQAKFWQICIAAFEGSIAHHFEMAEAIFHGRGTDPNPPKAISLMENAAKKNHIESIIFLGDWYISDQNSNPQPQKAMKFYRQAAGLKSNLGRMKLGLNYLNGVGCEKSFNQGCYWLERAAEKGFLQAMFHAGEAWMDVRPNGSAIAYIWLFVAGQLGYEKARPLRDQVAANLGVDTVVGLQSLSKPMVKKIRENRVGKHSLIKALNKLYKRDIRMYEDDTKSDDDGLNLEVVSEPAKVANESVDVSNESKTKPALDFSQTKMDS